MNIYRFLTNDGLVAGATNSDMTTTTDKYYAGPADGKYWVIHRGMLYIEDNGTSTPSTYGSATALTNGTKLYTTVGGVDGAENIDLFGGATMKANGNWGGICYDLTLTTGFGGGNDIIQSRYTYSKAGKPIILRGSRDEKIVMNIQDDLSALVVHTYMIQGYETNSLTGNE